jgi:predicted Zn finger-like uncharacterized protein
LDVEIAMPDIIACPSCGGKLRVPDTLRGQKVRCPACNHTFVSAAEPESPAAPPRAPHDLPLELSLDESSPPPAPSPGAPGLFGAVELKSASEETPPSAGSSPPPEPRRRPRLAERQGDSDLPDIRRFGPRRDAEPDRGSTVLALGIISLAGVMVWCVPLIGFILVPICAILGLIAWVMGQIDLAKMKRGQMDDTGRGMTQAGWICGIIGTVLNCLLMLACGLFVGGLWYSEMNRPPNTRPIPVTRPVRPVAPKGVNPPPVNPPGKQS